MDLPPPPIDAFATYLRRRLAEEGRPEPVILEQRDGAAAAGRAGAEVLLARGAAASALPGALGDLSRRFSGEGWALFDRFDPFSFGPPPADYRVLAIVTTFNESDIVAGLLDRLLSDDIAVHVIDNWSTDGTAELVAERLAHGRCSLERYPAGGPTPYFELRALLRRVEEVAHDSGADWVIHHDCDEVRESPWPGVGLRQALYGVERFGFTCIDHTVVNFLPVDNRFSSGDDLASSFRFFEFGDVASHFLEQKAWKPQVEPVRIAETGGHEADFAARRVFPYKFLLRHYPIRSQAHGERKIFRERQGRFHPGERAAGWHIHYDEHAPGESFLRDPAGLLDADDLDGPLLLQRLSGAGLPGNPNPGEGPSDPGAAALRRLVGAGNDAAPAALRVQLALAPLPPGALARALAALGRAIAHSAFAGPVDVAVTDRSTAPAFGAHRLDALRENLAASGVRALAYEHRGKTVALADAQRDLLALGPPADLVLLTDGSCFLGTAALSELAGACTQETGVVFARRLPLEPEAIEEPGLGRYPAGAHVLGTGVCALVRRRVLERAVAARPLDLVAAARELGLAVTLATGASYVADLPSGTGVS